MKPTSSARAIFLPCLARRCRPRPRHTPSATGHPRGTAPAKRIELGPLMMHEPKPLRDNQRAQFADYLRRLLPGVLLCVAITLVAMLLERIEVFFVGQPYLEALVAA